MSTIIFKNDKVEILQSLMTNKSVSAGAIGLMIYFIKSEFEDIGVNNIANSVKECTSSVAKYLSELKKEGFINIRRNILYNSKKIEFVYYINNPNRYKLKVEYKYLINKNNCNYALKKCEEYFKSDNLSLQHLGVWYLIECFSYKKTKISLDCISEITPIKINNLDKYIQSYNKVNQLFFQ